MQSIRLPRFHRASKVNPIAITQRDRETVRRVLEHRFLRSTHLLSLLPGSRQQILRRLHLLYHHGYLDRPRAQIDYYCRGSRAMVYGLGNEAMKLLELEDGIAPRKLDWTARNRSVTRFFLEHYGLMSRMHRNGDSITGTCPIHEGQNKTAFRVSVSKNCWNCFSRCGCGSNALDFVAKKERVAACDLMTHDEVRLWLKGRRGE